jgi:hypothetical protein
MSNLDLEVKDDAHMDELGKVRIDEIRATQMEILAEEDSGEETMGEDWEEEGY